MEIREWLTAMEVGQQLGVEAATIRNWVKNGLIEKRYVLILPHKERGAIRIHKDILQVMIQSSQSTTGPSSL